MSSILRGRSFKVPCDRIVKTLLRLHPVRAWKIVRRRSIFAPRWMAAVAKIFTSPYEGIGMKINEMLPSSVMKLIRTPDNYKSRFCS